MNTPNVGSSLLDKSKVKNPGAIDPETLKRFLGGAPKPSGQGVTNSNYLQETREQNPEASKDAAEQAKVSLVGCRFVTPADQLAPNQDCTVSVKVQKLADTNIRRVSFRFFCKSTDRDGKPSDEPVGSPLDGVMDPAQENQEVQATGKLPSPFDQVPTGSELRYRVEASHEEASATSVSDDVLITKTTESEAVSLSSACFLDGGHVPVLDESGALVLSLAQVFDSAAANPSGSWIVFGHKDPSEMDNDGSLTSDRARLVAMLLRQEFDGFGQLAAKVSTVAEVQTCLSILTSSHGWDCDPGTVDGERGPKTKAGVHSFQMEASNLGVTLAADGIAGPKTWAGMAQAIMDLVKGTLAEDGPSDLPKLEFGHQEGQGAWACEDPSSPGEGGCWAVRGVDVMRFDQGKQSFLTEDEEAA